MNNNNDLFPFPVFEDEQPDKKSESSLPSFPEAKPDKTATASDSTLTQQEVEELRSMLEWFRNSQTKPAKQAATMVELSSAPRPETHKSIIEMWLKLVAESEEPALATVANEIAETVQTIANANASTKISMALFGLLPVKKHLRHGTPEQQMFALNVMGDRFLSAIASMTFTERKNLLKSVAKALSVACDKFTFIQTEGEIFNPQHHERLPQSVSSGRTIREMHSFLVIETISNKLIRTSQVLT